MRYLLSALALFIGLSASSAKADTYEISVTNFDGLGSSLDFRIPSYYTGIRVPSGSPPQFIASSVVDFTYQTGATVLHSVATGTRENGPPTLVTQGPMYYTANEGIGFGGLVGFLISPNVGEGKSSLYVVGDPIFITDRMIYTVDGFTATIHPGTYGNITVVNATPEPSSLVLLGTGVLGAVAALRRKLTVS